jgi:hypothetical protein
MAGGTRRRSRRCANAPRPGTGRGSGTLQAPSRWRGVPSNDVDRILGDADTRRRARRRLPRLAFDRIGGAAGTGHGEAPDLAA